jgi:hypothetical protein
VPLPLFSYPRGQGYKEGIRTGYNMISIRTLSLVTYFTYIFIDIIIYALGSKPWSSGIFQMVGRVVADPSFGLLSPCGVVPRVPILVMSSPLRRGGIHRCSPRRPRGGGHRMKPPPGVSEGEEPPPTSPQRSHRKKTPLDVREEERCGGG